MNRINKLVNNEKLFFSFNPLITLKSGSKKRFKGFFCKKIGEKMTNIYKITVNKMEKNYIGKYKGDMKDYWGSGVEWWDFLLDENLIKGE
jgi:DNA gyrase/topoisomerase IV subunit B